MSDILILFATTTGNAEQCAIDCYKHLTSAGLEVELANMGEYPVSDLPSAKAILIFASTWGEGDPPDDAVPFYEALVSEDAPSLAGTQFAIFALGDRAYDDFCGCGRKLDEALEKLGGLRLHDRIECDVDFDRELSAFNIMLNERLRQTLC